MLNQPIYTCGFSKNVCLTRVGLRCRLACHQLTPTPSIRSVLNWRLGNRMRSFQVLIAVAVLFLAIDSQPTEAPSMASVVEMLCAQQLANRQLPSIPSGNISSTPLCKNSTFAALYDNAAMHPMWAAYVVSASHTRNSSASLPSIVEDADLVALQVVQPPLSSAFLQPGGSWSYIALAAPQLIPSGSMYQSKAATLANVVPIRATWKPRWESLVQNISNWMNTHHGNASNTSTQGLYIVSGAGYSDRNAANSSGEGVWYPTFLYMVVCDVQSQQSAGFVLHNVGGADDTTPYYRAVSSVAAAVSCNLQPNPFVLFPTECNINTVTPSYWNFPGFQPSGPALPACPPLQNTTISPGTNPATSPSPMSTTVAPATNTTASPMTTNQTNAPSNSTQQSTATPAPMAPTGVPPTPVPCTTTDPFMCDQDSCSLNSRTDCRCIDGDIRPKVFLRATNQSKVRLVEDISIQSAAFFATCAAIAAGSGFSQSLQYSWSIREFGTTQPLSVAGSIVSQASLFIPSRSLVADTWYWIALTVTDPTTQRTGTANMSLNVILDPPVIRILGGEREVSSTGSLVVTLIIEDPFLVPNVVTWSCCRAAEGSTLCIGLCRHPFDDLSLFKTSTLTLEPSPGFPFPTGRMAFVARYKGQSAMVAVTVKDGDIPQVVVFSPSSVLADSDIVIAGSTQHPNITQWLWSINGTTQSPLNVQNSRSATLVVRGGTYPSGTYLLVSLRGTTNQGISGTGSIVFKTELSLSSGSCMVQPAVAGQQLISTSTQLRIFAHSWGTVEQRDDLSYRFGYIDAYGNDRYFSDRYTNVAELTHKVPLLAQFITTAEREVTVRFFVEVFTSKWGSGRSTCQATVMTYLLVSSQQTILSTLEVQMNDAIASGSKSLGLSTGEQLLAISKSPMLPQASKAKALVDAAEVVNRTIAKSGAAFLSSTERTRTVELMSSVVSDARSVSSPLAPLQTQPLMQTILYTTIALLSHAFDISRDGRRTLNILRQSSNDTVKADAVAAANSIAFMAGELCGGLALGRPSGMTATTDSIGCSRRFAYDLRQMFDGLGTNHSFGFYSSLRNNFADTVTLRGAYTESYFNHLARIPGSMPAFNPMFTIPAAGTVSVHLYQESDDGSTQLVDATIAQSNMGYIVFNVALTLQRIEAHLQQRQMNTQDSFRTAAISFDTVYNFTDVAWSCVRWGSGTWSTVSNGAVDRSAQTATCTVPSMGTYGVFVSVPSVAPPTPLPPRTPSPLNVTPAPYNAAAQSEANALNSLSISLGTIGGIILLLLFFGVAGMWYNVMQKKKKVEAMERQQQQLKELREGKVNTTSLLSIPLVKDDEEEMYSRCAGNTKKGEGNATQEQSQGGVRRLQIDDEMHIVVSSPFATKKSTRNDSGYDPAPWL